MFSINVNKRDVLGIVKDINRETSCWSKKNSDFNISNLNSITQQAGIKQHITLPNIQLK